jgi:alanyl-tRNA synthetase
MNAQQIRSKYLKFFEERGHKVIPRASLVPQDDPTTLFTGSGMQPMIPYLLGEEFSGGEKRLVDSQPVFRAVDLDEIGDSEHLTSFEMLGNWSLGDYFKKEQIPWMAEFLFDVIKLDPNKVYVSCYIGNEKLAIPKDTETIELWKVEFGKRGIEAKAVELGSAENGAKLGMQGGRIFLYDGKENWWSRGGDEEGTPIGDPCGPDSEMFYDFGEKYHDEKKWGKPHPATDSPRFFEIGNNVFMGYQKNSPTEFVKLKAPNIDHGAGLERLAAAAINDPDVFKNDLLWPVIEKLEMLSGKTYDGNKQAMQVVSDHIKSACWLAVDGVVPSNKERGYVLRRLLRRAIRYAFDLGIEQDLCEKVAKIIIDLYGPDFPEIAKQEGSIMNAFIQEERIFRQTLRKGLKELEAIASEKVKMSEKLALEIKNTDDSTDGNYKSPDSTKLSGKDLFILYDTYGFPVELSKEEAGIRGIDIAEGANKDFSQLMEEQRKRSQTASQGMFKGGLADHSEQVVKYHTTTHLMYQALKEVLGPHVVQRGSNITAERTRFDFSHPQKMTPEEIKQVEGIVNQKIAEDLPVSWQEEDTKEAFAKGASGAFGDKYGETVKVYTIGNSEHPFSREICGGPHVEHTGIIGENGKKFKITKEEASSAGVRRIKAVLA